jgi:hypothetical protein
MTKLGPANITYNMPAINHSFAVGDEVLLPSALIDPPVICSGGKVIDADQGGHVLVDWGGCQAWYDSQVLMPVLPLRRRHP